MTAEILRNAAKVLRERAEAATPEYGWSFHDGGVRSDGTKPGDSGLIAYISLMSPTVGLALADWLDDEFAHDFGPTEHAITVARAILGGAS